MEGFIINISDTLRYFYSAVFQGFAAIIALGAMFFLYFRQGIENERMRIEERLQNYFVTTISNVRADIDKSGIIQFVRNELKDNEKGLRKEAQKALVARYDFLSKSLEKIEAKIPAILRDTIIILSLSLIFLFLVGYNPIGDIFLIVAGFFLIILSIRNLISIKNLILIILKKE